MTFFTTYNIKTATYGSYVKARNLDSAIAKLKIRGLNEKIIGKGTALGSEVVPPSVLYKNGDYIACAHTLCFIGHVLVNAKLLTTSDLLSDEGLIHELIHYSSLEFRKSFYFKLTKINKHIKSLGY